MHLAVRTTGAAATLAVVLGAVTVTAPSTNLPGRGNALAAPPTGGSDPASPGADPSNATRYADVPPEASQWWRTHAAADPAQAQMVVRRWCRSKALRAMEPSERFAVALGRLYEFTPTRERFERSVADIEDIRAATEARYPQNFALHVDDEAHPEVLDIGSQVERIVLHYTEGVRPSLTGPQQARQMAHMGKGTGYNYYLNDDGDRAGIWYTSGQFVHHVREKNTAAFGVEVAACSQADVTGRQYEQLLYLVAHFMRANGVIARDRPVAATVASFVVGHREYAGASGNPDFPKAVAELFRARLIGFLTTELGYRP